MEGELQYPLGKEHEHSGGSEPFRSAPWNEAFSALSSLDRC
jgi:hypothetical protein